MIRTEDYALLPSQQADHAYRIAVEERITNLLATRAIYRRNPVWTEGRRSVEVELRALVRLARQARRIAALGPDEIDVYKVARDRGVGYHDLQGGRLSEGDLYAGLRGVR